MLKHGLGVAGRLCSFRAARERCPERRVTAGEQRDWCGPHRRRATVAAVCARTQPCPGDTPRSTVIVQPGGLIGSKPRRQDLGLPGGGRRLEAFELPDHFLDCVRPFHARVGTGVLPGQQEAQEIAGRHRLDLGAQALDRVVMNARQQPPLAPFVDDNTGRESSAQCEAFALERRERARDLSRRQTKRYRERLLRDWTQTFEPAAHDFDQRFVARPLSLRRAVRRRDYRLEPRGRPDRAGTGAGARP